MVTFVTGRPRIVQMATFIRPIWTCVLFTVHNTSANTIGPDTFTMSKACV